MIYANDQWIQLPVKDLYDTQMMLTSINVAKDLYEKGQQEIKDFKKEYGDFLSPIQNDMDWYDQNVTGKVRDVINNLYANGIDPLRSAEGRAAISKIINNIDTGGIAQKKQAAQNANDYIKSREALKKAGLWNEDYERQMLGGQLLEEWDGSLGNWTATSASPYMDYEKKYGHLFDKMGYEYDPEESKKHPGMNVLTKNKQRMHDILSVSRPDLVNDPQYRYDLNRLRVQIANNNPNMSPSEVDALATKALENEIVERNYKGGMQLMEDPIQKEQRAFNNAVRLDNIRTNNEIRKGKALRANTPGYDSKGNPIKNGNEATSYGETLLMRGIANFAGSPDPGVAGLDRAKKFADSTRNTSAIMRPSAFLNFYGMPEAESTASWINRFHGDPSRVKDAAVGGVNYVPSTDNKLLYTLQEITSNTLDYPGYSLGWSKKTIPAGSSMVPTGMVYTAPMNDGTYSQYVEVKVGDGEKQSQNLFYKVAETEPVPVIKNDDLLQYNPWSGKTRNDTPFAPAGYSTVPSQTTVNKWSIMDAGLNSAAGLAKDKTVAGQGVFLDYVTP